jgi:1,4-dihydroxy-2-naphthoate octaprenyltransferase
VAGGQRLNFFGIANGLEGHGRGGHRGARGILLNECPDEHADRAGGRRNLVLLLGRKAAAIVYALAVIATPLAIAGAVLVGAFPALALIGVLPCSFVVPAVTWAFTRANEPVPIPALAGNVIWILAPNVFVAVGLGLAAWLGR